MPDTLDEETFMAWTRCDNCDLSTNHRFPVDREKGWVVCTLCWTRRKADA